MRFWPISLLALGCGTPPEVHCERAWQAGALAPLDDGDTGHAGEIDACVECFEACGAFCDTEEVPYTCPAR